MIKLLCLSWQAAHQFCASELVSSKKNEERLSFFSLKLLNDQPSALSARWNAVLLFQMLVPQMVTLSFQITEFLWKVVIAEGTSEIREA